MKYRIRLAALLLLGLMAGACVRHKIISDEELAHIFHDAFLTNAYVSTERLSLDSLNIYEPIFARYGYTTEDVQYTIGNFSKRKSARLGDVVEEAIRMLEEEGLRYEHEVAVLDTIDNVARRTFTRTVLADSLVRVRSLRDTARLHIRLDSLLPGEYNLTVNYLVDSLDRNPGLRGSAWLIRTDGSRTSSYTFTMRRNKEERFTRRYTADSTTRELHLNLFLPREGAKRPSVTLRDLEIRYTPPTRQAVESLYLRQLDIRIFADEFFRAAHPKDSL
ncbi:DUF4296 domain-containing protein [uncultured Alistipes sp.]|jgi:hypothetical protein|uniref:DUF4296 domain-containing protein n=1 Tax=uncultured Alistipes sp. TaxID=538949 RepID=UPI001F9F9B25|nr:DUF4296 domain-containing protein [uncultured Alistipes sp.]HJC16806.1 DUF4296 domain-containing protein [Candidatus Alistipes stercorigallinarum]